jgi:hypothetical protein
LYNGASGVADHTLCKYTAPTQQKSRRSENLEVFDHAGLLYNEPSNYAGVLFI